MKYFQFFWTLLWVIVAIQTGKKFQKDTEEVNSNSISHPRKLSSIERWFFGTKEAEDGFFLTIIIAAFLSLMIMGIIPLFAYEE